MLYFHPLLIQKKYKKAKIHANGGNQIQQHCVFKVGICGIFQDQQKPINKKRDNGNKEKLNDVKAVYLIYFIEIHEITHVTKPKHEGRKYKSASITQFVTDGFYAVRQILLVLIDLGHGINARNLKRASRQYPKCCFVDVKNSI